MAEGDHVARLRQGVEAWNQWRRRNPKIRPALVGASLRGADLREADLSDTTLFGAKLSGANLFSADLCDTAFREPLLRRVLTGHPGQTPAPRPG